MRLTDSAIPCVTRPTPVVSDAVTVRRSPCLCCPAILGGTSSTSIRSQVDRWTVTGQPLGGLRGPGACLRATVAAHGSGDLCQIRHAACPPGISPGGSPLRAWARHTLVAAWQPDVL